MPTYAYCCPACGHAFQRREKMSAATRTGCPQCGASAERQITGGAGVLVRGAANATPVPTGPSSCCGGGACGVH